MCFSVNLCCFIQQKVDLYEISKIQLFAIYIQNSDAYL